MASWSVVHVFPESADFRHHTLTRLPLSLTMSMRLKTSPPASFLLTPEYSKPRSVAQHHSSVFCVIQPAVNGFVGSRPRFPGIRGLSPPYLDPIAALFDDVHADS